MIPFNYKRAIAGIPVKTGKGETVTELKVFESAKTARCLVAVVEGDIRQYTIKGEAFGWTKSREDDLWLDQ